ncbi:hypothetical protein [Dolichospermum planctonicum]|nr:hypothetical protein [Dolichospermum planctonicum]
MITSTTMDSQPAKDTDVPKTQLIFCLIPIIGFFSVSVDSLQRSE